MVVKTLPKIDRWVALANLGEDAGDDLVKLKRLWDRRFGRTPKIKLPDVGQDRRRRKIYKSYQKHERKGVLILEAAEPTKRRRGRPAKEGAVIRFRTIESGWSPDDIAKVRELARSVRSVLDAIASATKQGSDNMRAGQKAEWHKLPPINLPDMRVSPALALSDDGRAVVLPDPYRQFLNDLNGVETFRIRNCPVCQRLFFAYRKDKGACSPGCLSINRVRTFRNPAKQAQYRQNRKFNESRKSKVIELRGGKA